MLRTFLSQERVILIGPANERRSPLSWSCKAAVRSSYRVPLTPTSAPSTAFVGVGAVHSCARSVQLGLERAVRSRAITSAGATGTSRVFGTGVALCPCVARNLGWAPKWETRERRGVS